MKPSSSEDLAADRADEGPGWAMAPCDAATAGFVARGSWLLEPDTGTGMLLYPRDWSFAERRDVTAHLRDGGWSVVPIARFLHLTSDGSTAIRLLARSADADDEVGVVAEGEVVPLRWDADHSDIIDTTTDIADGDALEASV